MDEIYRSNRPLAGEMQITQAFGREAPKAVAGYAAGRAADLRKQGNEEEAKKWSKAVITASRCTPPLAHWAGPPAQR
jgi:hypothetical protein